MTDKLKCKIEFELDGDDVIAEAINFKEEYPIEEDLSNLTLEDVQADDEKWERNVKHFADFEIEFFKSWTDYGWEYDSQYTVTNIERQ